MQTMQPNQMNELHYLLQSTIPHLIPHTFINNNNHNNVGSGNHQFPSPLYPAAWGCPSSNSATSDEAEAASVMHERRQRRMLSNRESARRSRMRKQRHLDELWAQVVCLRSENQQLVEKLNSAIESHERLRRENAAAKEEAEELRQMLTHMQLHSPSPPNHDHHHHHLLLTSPSQFE